MRLLFAGVILTALAIYHRRPACLHIWRSRRDVCLLAAYGVLGLMMCQYAYIAAISCSNAPTATVLQTLSLILILLISCFQHRRVPSRREGLALLLALLGTFLLATGGHPGQLVVSGQGLFWGLAAAAGAVAYSLLPVRLLQTWDRESVTGLGMLMGGVMLNLLGRSWRFQVELPLPGWLAVAAIVLLGTVVSFSLIMQAVAEIGSAKTSMMAATEPLSATLFSALWLKTAFSAADLIGFAAIVSTIFLLTRPDGQTPSAS